MECRTASSSNHQSEARDPDVDLRIPAQRQEWPRHRGALLAAIAFGGVLGAEARYGIGLALPDPRGGFPLAALLINATGCLLIGVLMVTVERQGNAHPVVRAFFGVGALGGYTTFSTYTLNIQKLLINGHGALALGYLTMTLGAGLAAVFLGVLLTRLMFAARRHGGHQHQDLTTHSVREKAFAAEASTNDQVNAR
ncbi:MAG: fluoride efflux transporter FluC [Sciscionella sp.]